MLTVFVSFCFVLDTHKIYTAIKYGSSDAHLYKSNLLRQNTYWDIVRDMGFPGGKANM